MKTTFVTFKSKSWGIIPLPHRPGHFHTGYEAKWEDDHYGMFKTYGSPDQQMNIGQNAIIEGLFRIDDSTRGRSAANFLGHFHGNGLVSYRLSMEGTQTLWELVQDGRFPITDGYIDGKWTFAKQGMNIFLKPYHL